MSEMKACPYCNGEGEHDKGCTFTIDHPEEAETLRTAWVQVAYVKALEAEVKLVKKDQEESWKYVLDTFQKIADEAGLYIDPAACSFEDYLTHPLELLGDERAINKELKAELATLRDFCVGVKVPVVKGGLKKLVDVAKIALEQFEDIFPGNLPRPGLEVCLRATLAQMDVTLKGAGK